MLQPLQRADPTAATRSWRPPTAMSPRPSRAAAPLTATTAAAAVVHLWQVTFALGCYAAKLHLYLAAAIICSAHPVLHVILLRSVTAA